MRQGKGFQGHGQLFMQCETSGPRFKRHGQGFESRTASCQGHGFRVKNGLASVTAVRQWCQGLGFRVKVI